MRVLHVNDYRAGGGCEIMVARTVALLRGAGVEAETFTADDVPGHRRTPWGYVHGRRCARALAARVRTYGPDVVHLHNFYHELSPAVLAVLRGRRVVMTAHDYHLACPNAGLYRLAGGEVRPLPPEARLPWWTLARSRWDHRGAGHSLLKVAQHVWSYRVRRLHERLDLVICPSRFMARVLAARGLPVAHVPNPMPAVAAARERGGPLRLVFAGRAAPEKGLEPFLELLPRDFPGRLLVVGGGPSLDACRAACARRGLGFVEFAGPLEHAETMRRIAGSHVLVLPSLWYENDPLSLVEAIAAGTSVLVSDLGGMKEIVERTGVGFTFVPRDAASLAGALARIAEAHAAGALNAFDPGAVLGDRQEERYVERLLEGYGRNEEQRSRGAQEQRGRNGRGN